MVTFVDTPKGKVPISEEVGYGLGMRKDVSTGGIEILGHGGVIRLAYRSHDATDRPPVAKLLALLQDIEEERLRT